MNRLLILCFWVICVGAQAQSSNPLDAYWNLSSVPTQGQVSLVLSNNGIAGPSSSLNDVTTRQNGVNNTALLSTASGLQNLLEINQYGNYNYTDASLSGIGNSVILNQMGGNNSASLGVGGTNNRYMISQDGGDRIQMLGMQQNNSRLEITQGSGSNSLTLDNTNLFKDAYGTGIPGLRIEQSGGATATIQNGHIFGN